MFGLGDQRHHVVQEGALGLDDPRHLLQVFVIDAGDQHRIHLDQDAARHQHLQPFLLLPAQSVVMLSLDDYKALEETAYLLRTPANAKRLLSVVARLNAGKGIERKLAK